MKIMVYDASSDELPYFEQYAAECKVRFIATTKPLSVDTLKLAKDCDGISDFLPEGGYSEEVVKRLSGMGIKYISLRTAGYDGIDLELLQKYGIKLANVPQYSPSAIAEFAVTLTLMLLRDMQVILPRVKTQDFSRIGMVGKELGRQVVGIVGTGNIGLEAAKLFNGFGAKVIGYDVVQKDAAKEILEYKKSLDELLAEATVVSLHIPLLPENHHIINSKTIAKMRDGAFLINTARGGHVDNEALLKALVSKKLAGAGIDVYEFRKGDLFGKGDENQIIDDATFRELTSLPNVIITPHTAYNTENAVANMIKTSTDNILEFVKTGASKNEIV
jgi:D-lactate dehydrogenase